MVEIGREPLSVRALRQRGHSLTLPPFERLIEATETCPWFSASVERLQSAP